MFCVIYEMCVAPEHDPRFIDLWAQLTHAIRDHEGGLGSRLHRLEPGVFVAYAQWPDRETWARADGSQLPPKARAVRKALGRLGVTVEVKYELNLLKDLLLHGGQA